MPNRDDEKQRVKENMRTLKQLQEMPLDWKIQRTIERLNELYGGAYISVSGGLGSTVLADIASKAYRSRYFGIGNMLCQRFPKVFVATGLEYPGVRRIAEGLADEVLRPAMRFDEVIETKGWPILSKGTAMAIRKLRTQNLSERYRNKLLYGDERGNMGSLAKKWHFLLDAPFKISEECCNYIKKKPAMEFEKRTGLLPITGEMAEESSNRARIWATHGCNAFTLKRPKSMPMSIWTKQDLLEYVKQENLEYAPEYGEIECPYAGQCYTTGEDRTGCMYCLFGIQYEEKYNNRFTRMATLYPRQYDYIINQLGAGEVLDYIGINYRPKEVTHEIHFIRGRIPRT